MVVQSIGSQQISRQSLRDTYQTDRNNDFDKNRKYNPVCLKQKNHMGNTNISKKTLSTANFYKLSLDCCLDGQTIVDGMKGKTVLHQTNWWFLTAFFVSLAQSNAVSFKPCFQHTRLPACYLNCIFSRALLQMLPREM